jgi:hypothetical protein
MILFTYAQRIKRLEQIDREKTKAEDLARKIKDLESGVEGIAISAE